MMMDSQLPNEYTHSPDANSPSSKNQQSKPVGSIWLAWIAILVTIVLAILPHSFLAKDEDGPDRSIVLLEMQAKYIVGASQLTLVSKESGAEQINVAFSKGHLLQRLIGIVLLGEVVGPDQAAKSLSDLKSRVDQGDLKSTESDREVIQLLEKLFAGRIPNGNGETNLTEDDRQSLREILPRQLGWVGRLGLAPAGTTDFEERSKLIAQARWTITVMLAAFGIGILAAGCGVVLQLAWWGCLIAGYVHSGISTLRGGSAIYAETFAVWMALYLVLSIGISVTPIAKLGLIVVLIPQIGGLAALAWPVMRGIRWQDVREDIGLNFGTNAWTTPFVGVATYLGALPAIGVAMVVTLIMMAIASQFANPGDATAAPIHPIVEPILRGTWAIRLQLMFVAVFAAVPEEIMFRGVLYRHLRESKSKLGYVGGVMFAAITSSFVFAAIHPQGLFGIPILMTLAIVFSIAREWRGSLVPCMIAHALVNAGTTTLMFLISD